MMSWTELRTTDERYPASLGRSLRTPQKIYTHGNEGLLARPAIGICGSRSASEAALRHAQHFGALASQAGFVVISGHAKGVDRAAHKGALEAGGTTIAVAPEGLNHFRLARELRELADEAHFLAVSQFEPDAGWASYRAMDRNRYLIALSEALFVIEARDKGGTFAAGLECLRQKKPLWVIDYEKAAENRAGNRLLIHEGGKPVRTTNQLKNILADTFTRAGQWPDQSSFFV